MELTQVQQVLNETRKAQELDFFKQYATQRPKEGAMLLEDHKSGHEEEDQMAQTAKATSPIKLRHFRKSTNMSRRSSDGAGKTVSKKESKINVSRLQKEEGLIDGDTKAANKRHILKAAPTVSIVPESPTEVSPS